MRIHFTLLMLVGSVSLSACSRGTGVEIANNDSAGLVRAIQQANASPGHDTIRLARNGLYVLGDAAQAGLLLPAVQGKLTIEGNHAEIRGYSPKPAALVQIDRGAALQLENLVLAEGTDGAIRNYGQLSLDNVAVVDSSVDRLPAIVLNHGRLQARDSEIAYNLLLASRRDAGTVLNYGEIELEGFRIHGNRALARSPELAVSGGILNFGTISGKGLQLEDNNLQGEDTPGLSFGGILNLGNGRVDGITAGGDIRDGTALAALVGL